VQDGELFVTGRRKELIIVCGRKLYPHDIEHRVALAHALLDGCGGAAFSVEAEAGDEHLVVVHEVAARRPSAQLVAQIAERAREAVSSHFDVRLHELVLVRPGAVPRTPSGKVQRPAQPALYRQHKLARLEVQP
jgi:acyl-CoA synthetase (AMP-forming)/AMP-acid ligase II